MNTKDNIDKIIKYSVRFTEELRFYTSLGLYDMNIHAENFFIPVLNQIFDLDLKNLNSTQKKNYPSIDLADFTNRTAFQVTSTNTNDKVFSTIQKFHSHKLHSVFTSLNIIIIGEKCKIYHQDKIDNLLSGSFTFNCQKNILDIGDLHTLISNLTPEKIRNISEIFEKEFSDNPVENRKKKFQFGFSNSEFDKLYLNLLQLVIPKQIYIADINIDEEENLKRRNDWRSQKGWKPIRKFKNKEQFINEELRSQKIYSKDWIQREGKLFTFQNLSDDKVPYSRIIDKGTITPIDCDEYYLQNEECQRVFVHLLRNTLIQDCFWIGLEWEPVKKVLRFKIDREKPRNKQIVWKGKKTATKTVITGIHNKTDGHLICFRHLAFVPSFEFIENTWYLSINSTWSYTNPYGFKKSRFEKAYLSGIKRIENNSTVCYFYKFWSYYLRYQDLLSSSNSLLKLLPYNPIQFSPKVIDSDWLPIRSQEEQTIVNESIVEMDKDLTLNLFDNEN